MGICREASASRCVVAASVVAGAAATAIPTGITTVTTPVTGIALTPRCGVSPAQPPTAQLIEIRKGLKGRAAEPKCDHKPFKKMDDGMAVRAHYPFAPLHRYKLMGLGEEYCLIAPQ